MNIHKIFAAGHGDEESSITATGTDRLPANGQSKESVAGVPSGAASGKPVMLTGAAIGATAIVAAAAPIIAPVAIASVVFAGISRVLE